MRIVTFGVNGDQRPGVVRDGQVVDLGPVVASTVDIIDGGLDAISEIDRFARSAACRSHPLETVRLHAPIPRPVRDVYATGWNYHDHFDEGRGRPHRVQSEPPEHPAFFSKATRSVIGPYDDIELDEEVSRQLDHEAEVAVVIGREGRNLDATTASEHIFGYMLANDVSARDLQHRHGGQWLKGKGLDRTCPTGPWIVTADEIPDPQQVTFECLVNGEVRQRGDTALMAFPVRQLIAELSFGMTLVPGDILLTGTPSGVGSAQTPPRWLAPGDEVVTRSPVLGEMRNAVARP